MDAESKSAKKNKRRNKKKKLGAEATAIKGGTSSPAYLLAALKEKLDEVKASEEPVGVLQSRFLCAFVHALQSLPWLFQLLAVWERVRHFIRNG